MKIKDAIVLLPVDSLEDLPLDQEPLAAESLLTAWTVPFHPAILAALGQTVRWESAEHFTDTESLAETLVLVPSISEGFLPDGWFEQANAAGALIARDLADRDATISQILEKLDTRSDHVPCDQLNVELTADMLALGFCHLLIELLTRQHYYVDSLDEETFDERALRAAEAIVQGDEQAAQEEIQNAFDVLTEGREYFYSLEPCLIDLTLVAAGTTGQPLAEELAGGIHKTLLISGQTVAAIAESQPVTLATLKKALADHQVDLAGGEFGETALALAVPEAILADIRRGLAVYEKHLGRRPIVFARRRFGLVPLLPQILEHCGFMAACHFTLDGGRFPSGDQSKIFWKTTGSHSLSALARVPVDASSVASFLRLPAQLTDAMDLDEAPTVVFAHWPGRVNRWYNALRRMDRYGPTVGRFLGIEAFFEEVTESAPAASHEPDEYQSPYLEQAVEKGLTDPISRWIRYYRRHAMVDSIAALAHMTCMIQGDLSSPDGRLSQNDGCLGHSEAVAQNEEKPDLNSSQPGTPQLQENIATLRQTIDEVANSASPKKEQAKEEQLDRRLSDALDEAVDRVAQALPRAEEQESIGRLYLNPWSFARSFETIAEDADRVEQDGRLSNVEVPAMGFAWAGSCKSQQEADPEDSSKRGPFWRRRRQQPPPMAEENVLRNEFFEATIDPVTGALRAIHDYHTRGNRLAAQLALRAPELTDGSGATPSGQAAYSIMAAERIEVENVGRTEGRITVHGRLVDRRGNRVAGFRQTLAARRASRVLRLDLELMPDHEPSPHPWRSYYAARFAWDDPSAELLRSVNMTSWPTEAQRFEAPHFVEIRGSRRRTTILTGGLPYHRQSGPRKLDCLLIVHGETARRFSMGIGIDLAHPAGAAVDFLASRSTHVDLTQPPKNDSGWLFHVDTPNVIATAWEPLIGEGRLAGYRVRLLETEGLTTRSRLQSFRPPARAEQADFFDNPIKQLNIDNGTILVDLKPRQWTQVNVHWPTL